MLTPHDGLFFGVKDFREVTKQNAYGYFVSGLNPFAVTEFIRKRRIREK